METIKHYEEYQGTLTNFYIGFYWSFITIYSVGYGDVFPTTFLGRVITIVTSIGGNLLAALVIRMCHQMFTMTAKERHALIFILEH